MTGDWDDLDDFFARPSRVATLDRPAPRRTAPSARRTETRPETTRPEPRRRAAVRQAAPTTRTRATAPKATFAPAPALRRTRPAALPRLVPPPIQSDVLGRRTRRRLRAFVVAVVLICGAITFRMVDLQLHNRDSLIAYGESLRDSYRILPAGRGAIYDRSGRAFALSVTKPAVVADPSVIANPGRVAAALAPVLDLDEAELRSDLAQDDKEYLVLVPTADEKLVAEVKDLNLGGIGFEDRYLRETPTGDLARAVVGSTYGDGQVDEEGRRGRTGLELAYEEQLAGTPGRLTFERSPNGDTIAGAPERREPAVPGTDLYLTLDQALQYSTEQALTDQVEATGATQGMAVISRPSTGEVLAMASVARQEDGTVAGTGDNRPVSTQFEPGSVNKMITVAGALEEGVISPDTPIEVPDQLQVGDHEFSDNDPHETTVWSPTDILVTSSNIGTIKIASMLGKERVDGYLRAFGFGADTPGFPGAIDGQMLPLKDWSGTSIGSIPLGQGISVTALQMLAAYNVIANDGIYVAPKLVAATDGGTGRQATKASDHRRVISAQTAGAMRSILSKVVSDGTGMPAQVPGYTAFGKTGTARIPQFGGDAEDAYKDAEGNYHYESSFVGGIDGADITIIVTIQDAKTSIYGSQVAAPVFAQLASLTLRHEQVPPPALVAGSSRGVPELSPSARQLQGEDPGLVTKTTQG